jgi:hypothetical protein
MGYVKYTTPMRRGKAAGPELRLSKAGHLTVNKALGSRIGLDQFQHYDVYVDRERKLVGIDVGKNFMFRAGKGTGSYRLTAVEQALKNMGVKLEGSSARLLEYAEGKGLPAPILLQFTYADLQGAG